MILNHVVNTCATGRAPAFEEDDDGAAAFEGDDDGLFDDDGPHGAYVAPSISWLGAVISLAESVAGGAIYQVKHRELKGKGVVDKRSTICECCKKLGHTREDCFKLTRTPNLYKELADKRKKGAGKGNGGFFAAIEEGSNKEDQRQVLAPRGPNFSLADMVKAELRKLIIDEVPMVQTHQ
ncbi:hypothetical protein Salat_1703900 [Sesamum alatum]|uniref:Uncharacterized protein n=1 Tax=Sesamum alatum TaxID=300844 RepID=A0AAE1Y8F5_9LAMI|nr:hypothetical protein Salat_1703900 [Sesamum alatum]